MVLEVVMVVAGVVVVMVVMMAVMVVMAVVMVVTVVVVMVVHNTNAVLELKVYVQSSRGLEAARDPKVGRQQTRKQTSRSARGPSNSSLCAGHVYHLHPHRHRR